jgi:hypothetical protein
LRTEVPGIAAAMIDAITATVPEYGSLGPAERESVRATVETAISQFLERLERGFDARETLAAQWRPGTGAWRSGRSLEALLAAFRVGARAAWERIAQAAVRAELDAATVSQLAGALFASVEQVAARASESYAAAQAQAAGEREANRASLAALLTRDPPPGADALKRAAQRASWRMPSEVAVIALADHEEPRALATRLGPDAFGAEAAQCVIVPDPAGPERRRMIERACRGHRAAIGPAVGPGDALRSLAWARETLALVLGGELPAQPAPQAEEHLLALALSRGGELIEALARRYGLDDPVFRDSRIALPQTLLTWLALDRSATAASAVLHVHPQTVRYRIERARELLGPVLDDPAARFELEAVLRWRRGAAALAAHGH